MLQCVDCGALWYNRNTCANCGTDTEVVATVESIIINELVKIITDSELFVRCGVVWSHNNPNDHNMMQIRLWASYDGPWQGGRYIGHVEVDNGIIFVRYRHELGSPTLGPALTNHEIPLADPLCFDHFKNAIVSMKAYGSTLQ